VTNGKKHPKLILTLKAMPPAARVTDPTAHPLPPGLDPGPGSPNVFIGNLPAWRAVPAAAASGIQGAKKASDAVIKAAEANTLAAAGTPAAPAAKQREDNIKNDQAAAMGATINAEAGGADIHSCETLLPLPPHGPGVVIKGSATVLINNLPAARMGDQIIEAVGTNILRQTTYFTGSVTQNPCGANIRNRTTAGKLMSPVESNLTPILCPYFSDILYIGNSFVIAKGRDDDPDDDPPPSIRHVNSLWSITVGADFEKDSPITLSAHSLLPRRAPQRLPRGLCHRSWSGRPPARPDPPRIERHAHRRVGPSCGNLTRVVFSSLDERAR
jgi:uncharacterized Zn-binding protein involved in type VI secretion